MYIYVVKCPHLVVSYNRGTPSHHPFLDGIFPIQKPSSYWGYPHDYGNPQLQQNDLKAKVYVDLGDLDDPLIWAANGVGVGDQSLQPGHHQFLSTPWSPKQDARDVVGEKVRERKRMVCGQFQFQHISARHAKLNGIIRLLRAKMSCPEQTKKFTKCPRQDPWPFQHVLTHLWAFGKPENGSAEAEGLVVVEVSNPVCPLGNLT